MDILGLRCIFIMQKSSENKNCIVNRVQRRSHIDQHSLWNQKSVIVLCNVLVFITLVIIEIQFAVYLGCTLYIYQSHWLRIRDSVHS